MTSNLLVPVAVLVTVLPAGFASGTWDGLGTADFLTIVVLSFGISGPIIAAMGLANCILMVIASFPADASIAFENADFSHMDRKVLNGVSLPGPRKGRDRGRRALRRRQDRPVQPDRPVPGRSARQRQGRRPEQLHLRSRRHGVVAARRPAETIRQPYPVRGSAWIVFH